MSPELRLVIIGGAIGIVGTLLGAGVGAIIEFWLGEKRDKRQQRSKNLATVLEWSTTGRIKNLRRIDLFGTDLRGIDLSCGSEEEKGADLSYSDLRKADLSYARLAKADLRGADLRGAILTGTDLSGTLLIQTQLGKTNLGEAIIDEANLYEANLQKAKVTVNHLRSAQTFDRAILPDGKVYKEDDG